MGSHMKRSIFDEQTSRALKKWHQAVRKRHKKGSLNSPTITPSVSRVTSPSGSPFHQFYRSRTLGRSGRSLTLSHSRVWYHSDVEISDHEAENTSPSSTANLPPHCLKHKEIVETEPTEYRLTIDHHGDEDFSFVNAPSENEEQPTATTLARHFE